MARRYKLFLIVGLVTFVADQITKVMARAWLEFGNGYGKPVSVIENFWDWRLSFNTGSAFGLFRDTAGGRILLTIIGLGAIVAILWMLRQARDDQKRFTWALGLVAGGALGNVLDRILYGKVTDFVVWRYYDKEWPTFNVADVALVIGVGLLFLDMGKEGKEAKAAAPEKAAKRAARR